ncbi:hypothetical protein CPC08DRAFT_714815 [Agrocybe pediades]|nr:hypothetical protein CPC08DRAFT_714815 [Agrocybe pediades]
MQVAELAVRNTITGKLGHLAAFHMQRMETRLFRLAKDTPQLSVIERIPSLSMCSHVWSGQIHHHSVSLLPYNKRQEQAKSSYTLSSTITPNSLHVNYWH